VKSFQVELRKLDRHAKVFAADCNAMLSAACQVADAYLCVPRLTDQNYSKMLLELCLSNSINLVIPTIDTELLLLAKNKKMFQKEGVTLLISDVELINICRDKRKIHKLFQRLGISIAREYSKANLSFPLFIKPIDGSSSLNTYKIEREDQLKEDHLAGEKLMFLEYIDPSYHTEFTVDLYYDKKSFIKCIVPRQRIEVRGGEVNKGITRKNFLVDYLKDKMNHLDGAQGCLTAQFFVNNESNNVIGIEINPRFGGGYPLTYFSGANYSKWVIEEYLFNKQLDYFDEWEDNLLMLRYDNEILLHDYKG